MVGDIRKNTFYSYKMYTNFLNFPGIPFTYHKSCTISLVPVRNLLDCKHCQSTFIPVPFECKGNRNETTGLWLRNDGMVHYCSESCDPH